jgi:hypothetical protein
MPSEGVAKAPATISIASVRILRLALGTSLSLLFSQVINWDMSFIAPVLTMFLLALPLPVIKMKGAIVFVLVLAVSLFGGLLLLPMLLNHRWVGILLLTLAMFHSFYYTSRGGNAVIGTFATVGIGLATAVGSVSIDGAIGAAGGVTIGGVAGIAFVWIAYAALPDSLASANTRSLPAAPAPAPKPDLAVARRSALRSLVIIMPVLFFFLLSSSSASYLALMIKVASMAQQAGLDQTRQAGKSLLISTVIGGAAAIVAWQILTIWPSLLMYALLIALAGLIMGQRIFAGSGMHPAGATWSYGYLTMIVVLAPAVMDGIGGAPAGAAFWSRLLMFVYATIYGVGAVYVFDAFWPNRKTSAQP